MPAPVVIDTNVAVVANGRTPQADAACVLACLQALQQARQQNVILIDDHGLILHEYMRHLSLSGQPGAGDYFMKWLWQMQANPQYCRKIPITPLDTPSPDFQEIPRDPNLSNFDPSDRKFLAVAFAVQPPPPILNAVDSNWANHAAVLAQYHICPIFLCPQHITPGR